MIKSTYNVVSEAHSPLQSNAAAVAFARDLGKVLEPLAERYSSSQVSASGTPQDWATQSVGASAKQAVENLGHVARQDSYLSGVPHYQVRMALENAAAVFVALASDRDDVGRSAVLSRQRSSSQQQTVIELEVGVQLQQIAVRGVIATFEAAARGRGSDQSTEAFTKAVANACMSLHEAGIDRIDTLVTPAPDEVSRLGRALSDAERYFSEVKDTPLPEAKTAFEKFGESVSRSFTAAPGTPDALRFG